MQKKSWKKWGVGKSALNGAVLGFIYEVLLIRQSGVNWFGEGIIYNGGRLAGGVVIAAIVFTIVALVHNRYVPHTDDN